MKTLTLTLSAALAAGLLAGSAHAERTVAVPYGDLNLATPDGQAELQDRLDKAARKVCRIDGLDQILYRDEERACYRAARQKVDVRFAEVVRANQRGG